MKKTIYFLTLFLCTFIIFSGCQNNEKAKKPAYTKSATCYTQGIGHAVVKIEGNDEESHATGKALVKDSVSCFVIDRVGNYSQESVEDKTKEILSRQTGKLDSFNIKLVDEHIIPDRLRDDSSSYDEFYYKVNYEYTVNVPFDKYIEKLENATVYEDTYSCIIDDDNELNGIWTGIDKKYLSNQPYRIELVLKNNHTGTFDAIDIGEGYKYDVHYDVKYNIRGNKLYLVLLEKETKRNETFDIYKYTEKCDIEDNKIKYIHLGEQIILTKK